MAIRSSDAEFAARKLKASASTDPVEKGRGDHAPQLTREDEQILDEVWDDIAAEDGL